MTRRAKKPLDPELVSLVEALSPKARLQYDQLHGIIIMRGVLHMKVDTEFTLPEPLNKEIAQWALHHPALAERARR